MCIAINHGVGTLAQSSSPRSHSPRALPISTYLAASPSRPNNHHHHRHHWHRLCHREPRTLKADICSPVVVRYSPVRSLACLLACCLARCIFARGPPSRLMDVFLIPVLTPYNREPAVVSGRANERTSGESYFTCKCSLAGACSHRTSQQGFIFIMRCFSVRENFYNSQVCPFSCETASHSRIGRVVLPTCVAAVSPTYLELIHL